jgi:hypothetical protein
MNLSQYTDIEEILKADGFDDAIIGIEESSYRLIYSVSKCINILINNQGMTEDDAIEYFWYNVAGSYVGEKTPIWCNDTSLQ